MTKLLQFLGGFILSFLLIVGLFTGIYWYTKEPSPSTAEGVNLDSLLTAGVVLDSLQVYQKERLLRKQEEQQIVGDKEDLARKEKELEQRQALFQEQLKEQLNQASTVEDSIMNLRYLDLAQYMENMKPIDAGKIMDGMSDFAAAKILIKMKKRKGGNVMASMSPGKVIAVSQLMTIMKE